jgi:hypothetical protein
VSGLEDNLGRNMYFRLGNTQTRSVRENNEREREEYLDISDRARSLIKPNGTRQQPHFGTFYERKDKRTRYGKGCIRVPGPIHDFIVLQHLALFHKELARNELFLGDDSTAHTFRNWSVE